ncbi:MAG: DUF3006 domain-containing protein [Candidatus Riflebacteria bacterium]|nr:DUF3006 domain-containing protein [Candidatus Riflebacteria bacterium]
MQAVIDKIEGGYVRCLIENGDVLRLFKTRLPEGVAEGDVLKLSFSIDVEATKRQRELMAQTAR